MKTNKILLVFLVAAIYLLLALSQRFAFLQPQNPDAGLELELSYVDFGMFPPFGTNNPFKLVFSFIPPTIQGEQKPAFISLEYVNVIWTKQDDYSEEIVDADRICINEIWVAELNPYLTSTDTDLSFTLRPFIGNKENLCFDTKWNMPRQIKETDVSHKKMEFWLLENDGFWYPFDQTEKNFILILSYTIYKDGSGIYKGVSVPGINFTPNSDIDWDIDWSFRETTGTKTLTMFFEENQPELKYKSIANVKFTRPLFIKILYPFLLFSTLLFIGLLGATDSLDTFIQGSLAILFGIYSLRQLMIPSDIAVRTFLDICILGLYFVFSFVVMMRVIQNIKSKKNQTSPLPLSEKSTNTNVLSKQKVAKRTIEKKKR